MKISTSFGEITINGKRYEYDVVVKKDGTVLKRPKEISAKKKTTGHTPFTKEELEKILSDVGDVDIVVIGTGQSGALPIEEDVLLFLEQHGFSAFIATTPNAIFDFVELVKSGKNAVGIFHITC
ncbi:MAG: hypothetical protein J7L47_09700 [Candidatus Odinarchaeota archaeon]|nr:hypothetical protein [Candidatus Odinarchaeota archaeon]